MCDVELGFSPVREVRLSQWKYSVSLRSQNSTEKSPLTDDHLEMFKQRPTMVSFHGVKETAVSHTLD